jgi:hypothetical protein
MEHYVVICGEKSKYNPFSVETLFLYVVMLHNMGVSCGGVRGDNAPPPNIIPK